MADVILNTHIKKKTTTQIN